MSFLRYLLIGVFIAIGTLPRSTEAETRITNEVDRIEVIGVQVFTHSEIEAALEIQPGDRLERLKVIRSIENIQDLYRNHGYEQITLKTDFEKKKDALSGKEESVLEFKIKEGLPARVSEIEFIPEVRPEIRESANFKKFWVRLLPILHARLGINVGDIGNQERLAIGKRAIQDTLAAEEYVGAKVGEVKERTLAVPPPGLEARPAAKWVKLEIHLELGDRVTFGFRGNSVVSTVRLVAIKDEQRDLGFGKDYIAAIRGRIEDEYKSGGYAQVKIDVFTFEKPETQERHVTYAITEGTRVGIQSLDFDGNSVFSNRELRNLFYEKSSSLLQHGYYSEKEVQKAADLVVEWIQSHGYLAAKLVTINTLAARSKRKGDTASYVRIIIYLYEGEQTLVESAEIRGASALSADEIRSLLGIHEGKPLDLFAFTQGIQAVKAQYRSRGYLSSKILNEGTDRVIQYSQDNHRADVILEVEEGYRYRISKVTIEGLSLTREEVVRRELQFAEGDFVSESALNETESRLRRLGIFSGVAIKVIDDLERPDHKILRVTLQEEVPGFIQGGVGVRNDSGVRLFGQTGYLNIGGRNQTVSLGASINRRFDKLNERASAADYYEYQTQLSYLWPWFIIPGLTFRPTLTINRQQYTNLTANNIAAATTWEKRLLQKTNLVGALTYSLERYNTYDAKEAADLGISRIGSISPSLRLDLRDDPLKPTSGIYSTFTADFSHPYLLSQSEGPEIETFETGPIPGHQREISYYRTQFRVDCYVPPAKDWVFSFSFRTGFEKNLATSDLAVLPVVKLFSLGGVSSLRGYKEQELQVPNLTAIGGTVSYFNYRTQLDMPFSGPLRFGIFFDAGNLGINQYIPFKDLKFGTGFGGHYLTPVGPVNFDFGFKLGPNTGESAFQFYFSVGTL